MELTKMQNNITEVTDLLRIMAHPERLMVLCQLTQGEVGAGVLQSQSQLSQSAFSQHLTVLRQHKLIRARKESQQVFYSLMNPKIEVLINCLYSIFCTKQR